MKRFLPPVLYKLATLLHITSERQTDIDLEYSLNTHLMKTLKFVWQMEGCIFKAIRTGVSLEGISERGIANAAKKDEIKEVLS
ncbi:hypothetical protein MKJ04_09530 [Pontibacter sp. E15-1]|uniref:hypothetical protein n=1 Tax=Pontibacter sp. E15-1 TaxID=2919918 RepID=UPI001F502FBA|nr:hypothetical protein [Pontibacter sp. E15-1]MCJ8165084.1 hypothetical protein [Pontibacter sp. E15-1]